MLTFNCAPMEEIGGDTALVPSCKYFAVFDAEGNCKILQPVTGEKSVLIFDGTDAYFANGDDGKPIYLTDLAEFTNEGIQYVNVMTPEGRLLKLPGPSTPGSFYLTSVNGVLTFAPISTIGIPAAGYGIITRPPYTDPDPAPAPIFLNAPGVIYIDSTGLATALPPGVNGQHLVLVNQIPAWVNQPAGSVSAGTASTGLSGVVAHNTSTSALDIQAASMTLDDGTGNTKYVSGVHVTPNLANPGLNGLDTGIESPNQWYYAYVVSDGTNVAGIISANGSAPDFTGPGAIGYSFYALASVFRNDNAGNIVGYMQRGRAFWISKVVMSDPCGINSGGFNPISQGIPLNTIVPPNVKTVSGIVGGSLAQNEAVNIHAFLASDNTGLIGEQVLPYTTNLSAREGFIMNYTSFYNLPILDPVSPAIYWKCGGAANSAKRRVVINGFEI